MPQKTIEYTVADDQPVILSSWIGHGQVGGMSAYLGHNLVGEGEQLRGINLGIGSTLRGMRCVVSAFAFDVNPAHDVVSNRVTLQGGVQGFTNIDQQEDVGASGATIFVSAIQFV